MTILPILEGQKYGAWTVLSRHSVSRNGHLRYLCRCECGTERDVFAMHLRDGMSRSCGCRRPRSSLRKDWYGHGEISGQFWLQLERSAGGAARGSQKRRTPLPFDLTIEYIWDLFLRQKRKCALTGIDLTLGDRYGDTRTASLDRIDNASGYLKGNVQWVHKDVNMMKGAFDQDYFVKVCRQIAENCTANSCEVM